METLKERNQFQKIKAVIFDFDGTLAVLNIDFSSMKEQVLDLVRHLGVEEGSIREKYLLEMIDEVYQLLLERDPSGAEEFYQGAHRILHEIELKAAGEGRLFPETQTTLKRLRKRGIKVGIVTRNCEDAVRKVFSDIEEYCDIFISRNSVKNVKPHPDHLTSVMNALHISGEEAVMVGDHPLDIQAGKRVGMGTIGVLTGRAKREDFEKAGADHILRGVTEVPTLLEG